MFPLLDGKLLVGRTAFVHEGNRRVLLHVDKIARQSRLIKPVVKRKGNVHVAVLIMTLAAVRRAVALLIEDAHMLLDSAVNPYQVLR